MSFQFGRTASNVLLFFNIPPHLAIIHQNIMQMQQDTAQSAEKVNELYQQFIKALESTNKSEMTKQFGLVKELFIASQPALRARVLQVQDEKDLTLLHRLTIRGKTELAKELLNSIPETNRITIIQITDMRGWTILNFARQNGNREFQAYLEKQIPSTSLD